MKKNLIDFLTKYRIILIFLNYIFGLSFLISILSQKDFSIIFMGLFFILFSFFKIIHIKKFKQSFSRYDLLARFFNSYGYIYPFIEISLGTLFLLEYKLKWISFATLIILLSTTIGIIEKMKKGQILECACLGVIFKIPLSIVTIFENTIMMIMALFFILD